MIRKVVKIDKEKCSGCGLCAAACHESAIAIIDGKAKLIRDDYCDGMGDCLPSCPMGAISFETREAADYDRAAVEANRRQKEKGKTDMTHVSCLANWPIQIKLAPIHAPYFNGVDILIAADCTAYAYADFQRDFMKNRVTLIGCPKLDSIDYSEKLTEILKNNDIRNILLVRMEVPCCGGLAIAVQKAVQDSGKDIPLQVVTVSINGEILG